MIIGLTGISGSGKSLAATYFKEKGFSVIDFDLLAREVVEKGSPCLDEIVLHFGNGVLDDIGNLKRRELGKIVFEDEEKLKLLNSITHKYIMQSAQKEIESCNEKNIILDAPLLFEVGLDRWCDFVVSVVAPKQTLIKRIMERDGLDRKTATDRINSRNTDFVEKSDFVVENNGTIDELYMKLNNILKELSNDSSYK